MITPLADYVFVRRKKEPYSGAMILPDSHMDKFSTTYEVVAVGPKVEHCRIGFDVMFGDDQKHRVIEHEGKVLFAIREMEIEAIMNEN